MSFEDMSNEELEVFRNDLQIQIEDLRKQFVEAGKVLDLRKQLENTPDINSALSAAEAEVARLQALKSKVESTGVS